MALPHYDTLALKTHTVNQAGSALGHHLAYGATRTAANTAITDTASATALAAAPTSIATASTATNVLGAAATGFSSVFSVATIGIASAASVIINYLGYNFQRTALRDLYKDEIAAHLKKDAKDVTNDDLDIVAKGNKESGIEANKTIAKEVSRLQRSRNIKFVATAGSLLLTLGIMGALTAPAVVGAVTAAIPALGTAFASTGGVGMAVFKTVAAILLHTALEKPIHDLGHKLFGFEDTVSEQIATLSKQYDGKQPISREQVVGVFVASNDDLKKFVKDRHGKSYSDLSIVQKRDVTEYLAQYMNIDNVTDNLNMGRMKVTELAYTVEGQQSGVLPHLVENPIAMSTETRSWLDTIANKLHIGKNYADKDSDKGKQEKEFSYAPKARKVVEYDNPTPERSFTERLGRGKEAEVSLSNSR